MSRVPHPTFRHGLRTALLVIAPLVACWGCGSSDSAAKSQPPETGGPNAAPTLYPDVLAADAQRDANGTWRFDVTLSSPYDSPERYADAWRVLSPDGEQLGIRILRHDHAGEQPFTRSLDGVRIPPNVTRVVIEGRDQVSGWGGATVEVALQRD